MTALNESRDALRAANGPPCARLSAGAAANLFGVPLIEIDAPTRRTAPVARARQVAIYLAHVGFGEAEAAVSAAFNRHRTTVRHACALIEDRRDDGDFDWSMDVLEAALRGYASAFFTSTPKDVR